MVPSVKTEPTLSFTCVTVDDISKEKKTTRYKESNPRVAIQRV